jgi:glutamine---fructose-6-phosphate transaminase (isomerizing)
MCGIFAYKGTKDCKEIIFNGLKYLEYRGYDSWGIAFKNDHHFKIIKKIGTITIEKDLIKSKEKFNIGIGHTRWATHGAVTIKNTHPHNDHEKNIYVVHNGIIENYEQLKKIIKTNFYSETDTEIIPKLINHYYNLGFEESVKKTLKLIKGSFAFVAIDKKSNTMIAAKKGSPLIIGLKKDEFYLSSDIPSILNYTNEIIYLEDNEMVTIEDNLTFFDFNKNKNKNKKTHKINTNYEKAVKGKYEHFMLKEIHEQGEKVDETIKGYIRGEEFLFNNYMDLNAIKNISNIKRIVILGCGTSWHSGLVAEYWFENIAKINAEVEYASEFRYRNPVIEKGTLIIAISQSGETADTIAAINEAKKKGAKILSICNVSGSTIDRLSDIKLYTRAGPEIGVASTKAFTTQLTLLFLIVIFFALKNKKINNLEAKKHIEELNLIPAKIKKALKLEKEINLVVKKYYNKKNALFLGRGVNYPIALEGALKLKEISYIHAEGYPAAEMKHGAIALIDKDMPSIFICVKDKSYEKVLSNIQEVKARKGKVIAIANEKDELIKKYADFVIPVPYTSNELSPLITVIPLQLLAYYIAKKRKCNIDKPRNLAKSVTVE